MKLSRTHLAGILGGALSLAYVLGPAHVLGDESHQAGLKGSFQLDVVVSNPPGFGEFPVLMTVVPDGGVVATRPLYIGASPAGGLLDSPNHGAWAHLDGHSYAITLIGFSQGAPGNDLLPGGAPFATEKIIWEATQDPHTGALSGPWHSTFTSPQGQVIFAVGGTITGTRIQPEMP
jgi:hypothetical protein